MQASTRGKKKKSSLKSGKKGAGERRGVCREGSGTNCVGEQKSSSYEHPDTSTIQDIKAQGLLRWAWGADAVLLAAQKPSVTSARVPRQCPPSHNSSWVLVLGSGQR